MSHNKPNSNIFTSLINHPGAISDWTELTQVKQKNVNHPPKLSSDGLSHLQLHSIHNLSTIYFEELVSKLNQQLLTEARLLQTSYHHKLAHKISDSINENDIILDIKIRNLGSIYIIIPISSSRYILNQLFNSNSTKKSLTAIETSLLISFLDFTTNLLPSKWNNIFLKEDLISTNLLPHEYNKTINADKNIISQFHAVIKLNSKKINFSMHYSNELLKKLVTVENISENKETNHIKLNENAQLTVPVEVSASLGKTKLVLSDIMNLQIGDVVILDNTIEDPIISKIGDQSIYSTVGKQNDKVCIKLLEAIQEVTETPELFDENSMNSKLSEPSQINQPLPEENSDTIENKDLEPSIENETYEQETEINTDDFDDSLDELNTIENNELELEDNADDFLDTENETTPEALTDHETGDASEIITEFDNNITMDSPSTVSTNEINESDDDDFSWDDLDDI